MREGCTNYLKRTLRPPACFAACGGKGGRQPHQTPEGPMAFRRQDQKTGRQAQGRDGSPCPARSLPRRSARPFAELRRGRPRLFPKGLCKIALVLEAARGADIQNRQIGFKEELLCLPEPQCDHILDGGGADDALKRAQALPAADKSVVRNLLDLYRRGVVRLDKRQHLPDPVDLRLLAGRALRPARHIPAELQNEFGKGAAHAEFVSVCLSGQEGKSAPCLFECFGLPQNCVRQDSAGEGARQDQRFDIALPII